MFQNRTPSELREDAQSFGSGNADIQAPALSPEDYAGKVLEVLWQASVSGVSPRITDQPQLSVATLDRRMVKDDPPDWHNAGKYIERGARLNAAGDRAGALLEFGVAYALTAPATGCLLQIASVYLAAGKYDQAELWLRRKAGEVGGGSDPDTYLHLAHALWGGGRFDDALAVCDKLMERYPHHVPGIDTAALMHTERGDPQKALDACLVVLSDQTADASPMIPLVRRLAVAAARLGILLPQSISDRITSLAAASGDKDLVELARRVEIHAFAQRNWINLFSKCPEPFHDHALTPAETTALKELLAIERSAPVIGFNAAAGFEPKDQRSLLDSDNHDPASTSVDLSSDGIVALQVGIIKSGRVVLTSPFGGVVSSSSSIVLNYHPINREYGSVIAYYIDGERPLFVFFATEDNWPVAWYDPVAHLLICYDGVMEEFTAYLQDRVRELKLSCLSDPGATNRYLAMDTARSGRPPTLFTGTLDYLSTHLFADLQGLQRLAEHLPTLAIDSIIVAAPEPFGPIEAIIPEFNDTTIIRDIPQDAVALNHHLWRSNRMLARITGCLVEQTLADKLIARAKQLSDPSWQRDIDDLRATSDPLLFLSLRTHSRRWLAPASSVAGIFNRLHARYPKLAIILDGHCLGGTTPSGRVIDEENALISGIISHLNGTIRYLVSAGRTLQDSIYAASACTTHLSAQGTSATKSVLIAGLPGVVIGSRQFGWDATAFRTPRPQTVTLSQEAIDAEEGNIQCDFTLDPEIVYKALVGVIDGPCSDPQRPAPL